MAAFAHGNQPLPGVHNVQQQSLRCALRQESRRLQKIYAGGNLGGCLLYTSDAADEYNPV